MNIVIVGDGKVGNALSAQLNLEGHNITVIDTNQKTLDSTVDMLDVLGIHGNGASRKIQLEAGVPGTDLLIAATSGDELNIVCCLTAKSLGAKNTIARIRNPEYLQQLHMFQEQFGLSMIINPELEAAREISRVVKFPPALKVDVFSKGGVELVEFRIPADSPVIGKRLTDLFSGGKSPKVLICAVERGGEISIPHGTFVLQGGDRIHVTGESRSVTGFLQRIGGFNYRIRSLIIVGGGRIGYYLASMLNDRHFQVKIIERDEDRCQELCELLPKAVIIHGDGAELELLESEGIGEADAFVALTGMDEENMIMSMVAKQKQVPKVITKVSRSNYLPIADKMDLDTVVSPKMTTATQITQYVRAMQNTVGSEINTLHKLLGGNVEALEFTAGPETRYLGKSLGELQPHLKKNLLIGVIVHNGAVVIPHGKDVIRKGDSVVVITNRYKLKSLNDIFES